MADMQWFCFGGLLGLLSISSQWWTAQQLNPQTGYRSVLLVIIGAPLRFLLAAGLMIAALQQGILAGILVFLGLWLARWISLIWIDRRT